ncbi:MAG: glycerophosphodiester phosphodiesterase family protein [Actinomycetota bacterium]
MRRVWNVAHRGASGERPENTLPAFQLAIEQGADVIEADVRATADGKLAILHDPMLDRTTNGSGPLRVLTLAQARKLDAGDGQPIPTVEEVLDVARGRTRVNLDLKEVDVVEPAVRAVERAGMLDSVTFISFLPEAWDILDRISPESPVVQLVDSAASLASIAMGEVVSHAVRSGVGMPHALVGVEIVERLHMRGLAVYAWTVDDEAEMRRLIHTGVNGIVTNRPAALARVLRQEGTVKPGAAATPS